MSLLFINFDFIWMACMLIGFGSVFGCMWVSACLCVCASFKAVDPSSEALLLLPDINTYTCVYQYTDIVWMWYVCVCVLVGLCCQLNVILNFFLESVLGMSYAMQAHSYRKYFFLFSLTYTKHNFTCSCSLSSSFVLPFFLCHFRSLYFTSFGLFSVKYFSITYVCSIQLFVKLYYRIQTIFFSYMFCI